MEQLQDVIAAEGDKLDKRLMRKLARSASDVKLEAGIQSIRIDS